MPVPGRTLLSRVLTAVDDAGDDEFTEPFTGRTA